MKQFFTTVLAFLLLALAAPAQTTDPVRQKLDLIFANLDKSQVPTGRLVEAAVPLAPLANFDGAVLRDTGRADMDVFRHLYATALSSRLAGPETLPALAVLNQRVAAAAPAPGGAIPIAVQYISYARLRPDAETAGLVTLQNEQLRDVPGRTQSPYQTAVLFAAAPERAYAPTNTVSLVLPSALYLASGAPSNAPAAALDFGDGQGYRPAAWGQPLSTTYATAGTKRVKVKLTYTYRIEQVNQSSTSSGTRTTQIVRPSTTFTDTRESWFDLEVFAVAAAARYSDAAGFEQVFAPTATPVTIAGTVSYPPNANFTDHLGATVNVRFGQGHTSIVKPFIVVEGYNTSRIAPHLVGKNNKNNDVEGFLEKTAVDPRPFDLNHQLEQAGYDLIYIDFNEGTDYIQRNAALFEQVLRWVNDQKLASAGGGNVESNVVMGESMGGLVARYGLARLVRNGYDPQTRKLILHDSPQRGAYSPMGFQALTRHADFPVFILPGNYSANSTFIRTSDLNDKLKEALAILNAPATRQLALKSVTGINDEYDDNTFIDGPYKDKVDFTDIGGTPATFPVIVATSDGSQCGRLQNTPAYQELTRNERDYILGPLSYLLRGGIQTRAIANALPAYGTRNTIASLRVWFTIQILWARLDITLLNRAYTSPANTLPYETLPGGTVDFGEQQDLADEDNYSRNFIGFWRFANNTSLYHGPLCFVPSYSALDVQTVTPATAAVSYLYGVPPQTSAVPRVARFIAMESGSGSTFNQSHLRFTARNSEWIFNEMQGIANGTLNCQTECNPYPPVSIAGPDIVCAGSTGTTFTVVPPFGGVTGWTASPAGLVTFVPANTAGATSVTVVPASASSTGLVTLTAHLSNSCYQRGTEPLRVAVGGGFLVIDNNNQSPPQCAESGTTFTVTASYGARGPFTWAVSDGTIAAGQGTDQILVTDLPNQQYTLSVSVSSPATCPGSGDVVGNGQHNYVTTSGGYSCPFFRSAAPGPAPATAALYPNPARETVAVHIDHADAAHPVTVRLFDGYGRPRAERTSRGGEATLRLDTGTLPAGLYFVHLLQGGRVLSRQQLRVEK